MTDQALAGKKAFVLPPTPTGVNSGRRRIIQRYWHWAVVVLLAIILWAPRLSGPIDLRWDGGVYYLLGTSLATGHGYRILSEPGSPEALQYPPLLPAVVALYERALGSTDPAIVAPWLRISYAAMFLVYALAVFALARKYLRPTFALIATAPCLFHIWTIFLSDVLFAEIPFAMVSVVFVLVATNGPTLSRPWLREAASFVLATAGFLLRTAGIVLFAAWLIEAVLRRQWQLAFARGVLALLPVALWQAHVERVHHSDEYRHPAYEYQRAPYQNYNVTYSENFRLLDPFRPERGLADKHVLATRLEKNFVRMPVRLGEAISAPKQFWQSAIQYGSLRRYLLPGGIVLVPIVGLGVVVIAGFVLLIRRREWTLTSILFASIGLICFTPWPEEFHRYLTPVCAFLTIAAVLALQQLYALHGRKLRTTPELSRVVIASLVGLGLAVQTATATRLLLSHHAKQVNVLPRSGVMGAHFFHNHDWFAWEQAVGWIGVHAGPTDIVATTSPHQVYLRIGLHAVYPPFVADPGRARRQLEAVPVKYVIIDEFEYRDFSRRYALPAVEGDPLTWRLVYSIDHTRVYEHIAGS